MREKFLNSDSRKFVLLCSRRLGKSYLLAVLANEQAQKKAKSRIFWITATHKDTKNIVRPIMDKVLEDCPIGVRPTYKAQDNKYVFPNGSELFLIGVDKNPDGPRGQEGELIILDEFCFIDHLSYLVGSVLLPMLMMTNGRILMASTPPKTTDHDSLELIFEAQASGNFVKKVIYDCPRATPKMIAEYMAEAGGEDSPNWKREYLCEILQDEERSVFPEFDEKTQQVIIKELPRPAWAARYVGMDLGFTDNTAALFAWWDFENARLVIEDEFLANRQNTLQLATALKQKEKSLWGDGRPYKRVADHNNPQLIYDLNSIHGLTFTPANKEAGKEPMINKVRLALNGHQIIINPRCRNLINQLKFCRWKNSERTTFDRSEAWGHFDLADALILLFNSVNRAHNPIREVRTPESVYYRDKPQNNHPLQALTGRKITPTRRF